MAKSPVKTRGEEFNEVLNHEKNIGEQITERVGHHSQAQHFNGNIPRVTSRFSGR